MPGTIKDPRMNRNNEKEFGIVYIRDPFQTHGNELHQKGHYFYEKESNHEELHSSRYYPAGFPVVVSGESNANLNFTQVEIDEFLLEYPNLRLYIILKLDYEFEDDIDILDNEYPMTAYLHRVIQDDHPVTGAENGRGLKKFDQGIQYKYNRGYDNIGKLDPVQNK